MVDDVIIKTMEKEDAIWLSSIIENEWGGNPLVIRTVPYYPEKLPGLIAFGKSRRVGFLSYEIRNKICEIIAFEVFEQDKGIGTMMVNRLKNLAKQQGCTQIYLMTTNDNVDALRFYQKKRFYYFCNPSRFS